MTSAHQGTGAGQRPAGLHVATIAHQGLLWEAYLEFVDEPRLPRSFRGRFRFERSGQDGAGRTAETTVVIIEDSYEEAVGKARSMDDRQLESLLRSALPSPD